jgi:hypothetical protein
MAIGAIAWALLLGGCSSGGGGGAGGAAGRGGAGGAAGTGATAGATGTAGSVGLGGRGGTGGGGATGTAGVGAAGHGGDGGGAGTGGTAASGGGGGPAGGTGGTTAAGGTGGASGGTGGTTAAGGTGGAAGTGGTTASGGSGGAAGGTGGTTAAGGNAGAAAGTGGSASAGSGGTTATGTGGASGAGGTQAPGVNLIKNGNFSQGGQYWTVTWPGAHSGNPTFPAGEACIYNNSPGVVLYNLVYPVDPADAFAIEPGATYTFSYDAVSSDLYGVNLTVSIYGVAAPNTVIYSYADQSNNSWKTLTHQVAYTSSATATDTAAAVQSAETAAGVIFSGKILSSQQNCFTNISLLRN